MARSASGRSATPLPARARAGARSARQRARHRPGRRTPPPARRSRAWWRGPQAWRRAAPTALRGRAGSCERLRALPALQHALHDDESANDHEIDRERDQERWDGIVGCGADADRGARRLGHADHRHRRADLDQQGHLVDQRRQRGARDLRQHDEAEAQTPRHAEGARGIELLARKGDERRSPDLAVVGHGSERQGGDAGGEARHLEAHRRQCEIDEQHERHGRRGAQQADERTDEAIEPAHVPPADQRQAEPERRADRDRQQADRDRVGGARRQREVIPRSHGRTRIKRWQTGLPACPRTWSRTTSSAARTWCRPCACRAGTR